MDLKKKKVSNQTRRSRGSCNWVLIVIRAPYYPTSKPLYIILLPLLCFIATRPVCKTAAIWKLGLTLNFNTKATEGSIKVCPEGDTNKGPTLMWHYQDRYDIFTNDPVLAGVWDKSMWVILLAVEQYGSVITIPLFWLTLTGDTNVFSCLFWFPSNLPK